MAYGTVKAKSLIYESGGSDVVFSTANLIQNGDNFSGSIVQGQTLSGATGIFTNLISGNTIRGTTFSTPIFSGATGIFTALLSGLTITGTAIRATTITGSSFSGVQFNGTTGYLGDVTTTGTISGVTLTGNTGRFTNITGVTGVFTSLLSGVAITGTNLNTTTLTGQSISGNTIRSITGNIGDLVSTGTISGTSITGTNLNAGNIQAITGVFTTQISGGLFKAGNNTTVISGNGNVRPFGVFSFPAAPGVSGKALVSNGDGTTKWGADSTTVEVVTGVTVGTAGSVYVLSTGAAFTLPGSPVTGAYVSVINRSNSTTGSIGRNGNNIMGLAENLLVNDINFAVDFIYYGGTEGWVLI